MYPMMFPGDDEMPGAVAGVYGQAAAAAVAATAVGLAALTTAVALPAAALRAAGLPLGSLVSLNPLLGLDGLNGHGNGGRPAVTRSRERVPRRG